MYKIRTAIVILAAIMLASCAQVTITGSGNVITQDEVITDFDKLDISNSFTVDITQGDSYAVVIRVDDNIVEYLHVVKDGNTLEIGLDPNRSYTILNATMEAEVTMPELVDLDLSGNSEAAISGFETSNSMTFDISGNSRLSGDIEAGDASFDVSGNSVVKLSGSAGDLTVDASGSSDVDLAEFPGLNGNVDASGSSTVNVNLSGTLDADASGSSDIYYLGNPQLGSIETSGSSNIQPK